MISEVELNTIRDTFRETEPKAAGYRVLIRPIDATQGLEAAEAAEFETLAASGFQTKSKDQESRECFGLRVNSDIAIGVSPWHPAEHRCRGVAYTTN